MAATQAVHSNAGLRVFQIMLIIIPTIALCIRFWSRTLALSGKAPKYWWDDWTALIALVWLFNVYSFQKIDFLEPFSISTNALELYYMGIDDIGTNTPQGIKSGKKVEWAYFMTFDIGISMAKTSALFFYARVFTRHDRRFRWALWTTHTFVLLWLIALIISTICMCIPVQKYWHYAIPGHCRHGTTAGLSSAIASAIIDLIILLLPMPMLWNLQTKLTRKILISGVILCGYGVIVISIGRMIVATRVTGEEGRYAINDAVTLAYWQGAETPLSILCLCLPSIFFLVRHAVRNGFGSLFTLKSTVSQARLKREGLSVTGAPFPTVISSIRLGTCPSSNHSGWTESELSTV